MIPPISRLFGQLARRGPGLLLAALLAGCGTINPNPESFASVIILNHSEDEIQKTTVQVFREAGFRGGAANLFEMVFERPAGTAATLSREGVWATQQGAQTIERVRAEIVGLAAGKNRLQCQAYMVSNAGDSVLENEVALAHIRSIPYQSLMDAVATRLK
jgi:hypothetical protein